MDQEAKSQWIAALRSGKYTQGRYALTTIEPDGTQKDCCLGVLCKIQDLPSVEVRIEGRHYIRYLDARCYLPMGLMEKLSIDSDQGMLPFRDRGGDAVTLTICNDAGLTFDQIADLIEAFL